MSADKQSNNQGQGHMIALLWKRAPTVNNDSML